MSNGKEQKKAAIDSASRQEIQQRLGQRLTDARTNKNRDITTIANHLRLQPSYIEALESGDWSIIPDKVYAMGFIRQYADTLNLDVSDEIELLKTGVFSLAPTHTIPDPSTVPSKTWFRITLTLFAISFIIFNVFYFSGQSDDILTSEIAPISPSHLTITQPDFPKKEINEITKPKSVTRESESSNDIDHPTTLIEQAITLDEQIASDRPTTETIESNTPNHNIINNTKAETVEQVTPTTKTPTKEAVQSSLHTYQFSAQGQDVWLKVAYPKKNILLQTLIPSGLIRTIQHSSDFLYLTCGNAVALTVHMDGKKILSAGELGKSGQVVRHYKIGKPTAADE